MATAKRNPRRRKENAEGSREARATALQEDCIPIEALLAPYLVEGPDSNGERRGHCVVHPDANPSCSYNLDKGVYHCHAGCGGGPLYQLHEALSGRHEARFVPGWVVDGEGSGRSGPSKGSTWPLPDEAQVAGWHARLLSTPEALTYLTEARGVGLEVIERYQIGLRSDGSDELVFPVYDAHGDLVNVRRRRLERGRNMRNWCGHGSPARLYPVDQLEHDELIICEGELDALAAISVGISAITTTGGAGGLARWRDEWTPLFAGKVVYLLPDCDEQSKLGMQVAQAALRSTATVSWLALPYDVTPEHGKDLTDYLVRDGHSKAELLELMQAARTDGDDGEFWFTATGGSKSFRRLSSYDQTKRVRWLWKQRIPMGKLAMLDGDPERGKSLITVDLAARVSTGSEMPDSTSGLGKPGGVILTCAEDDIEDTIIPRLLECGADLDMIVTIPLAKDDKGNVIPLSFPEDLPTVRKAVRELLDEGVQVALIVIDPISAYLSESINSHNDASVRTATTPLGQLAQELSVAVLLVRHLNKQGELKALYRGGGSIAFSGAARSVLVVDSHPYKPEVYALARVKNNLALPVPSLTYQIVSGVSQDVPRIKWGESELLDADELVAQDARRYAPQRRQAKEFLLSHLADGPKEQNDVVSETKKVCGVSEKVVREAARELNVVMEPERENGRFVRWIWGLPGKIQLADQG